MFNYGRRTGLWIPVLLACAGAPATAASFDCAKATTWTERMICDDEALGQLDERLATLYREAEKSTQGDPQARERLTKAQRSWLTERDTCQLSSCLQRLYDQRIAELGEAKDGSQVEPLGQQKIQKSGPHLSIDAAYPVLPGGTPAFTKVNQEIHALVELAVDDFLNEAREFTEEREREDVSVDGKDWRAPGAQDQSWAGPEWVLSIDYGTPHRTERYLAIPFTGYEYTGGAHGMPLILPLVLDLATGQRIPPEGLFLPGSDWLDRLSERSRAALKGRDLLSADDRWLLEGTAPKAENFVLLFPGPDGLTVTFAPYTVAPYAAGPQEVLIPYPDLAGLLNPALFGDQGAPNR